MNYLCNTDKYSVDKYKMRAERCTPYRQSNYCFNVQPKPVYSNLIFAAKNGKKEPIVRKNRRQLIQNVNCLHIKRKFSVKKSIS